MKKRTFYSEIAYLLGLIQIAIGVVLMEKADFGVSMIVAPAYILYRRLSQAWAFFTFGMAEYCLQAVLILVLMALVRQFKISYLLSFATALIYGFILDGCMALGVFLPAGTIWQRGLYFVLGVAVSASGVSMMFHTYLSPEAYELFVKEIAYRFHLNIHKFKTVYDCASLLIGVVMSFLLFGAGNFVGVQWGTIVCALVNGFLISRFSKLYDRFWSFRDALSWRPFFEQPAGKTDVQDEKQLA